MDDARAVLETDVAAAAGQVAAVLKDNPVRGSGAYPMLDVLARLAEQQQKLQAAVTAFPLAVTIDQHTGKPHPLGQPLAELAGSLARFLVRYHQLLDIPAGLRSQAHRDVEGLTRDALAVIAITGGYPA